MTEFTVIWEDYDDPTTLRAQPVARRSTIVLDHPGLSAEEEAKRIARQGAWIVTEERGVSPRSFVPPHRIIRVILWARS